MKVMSVTTPSLYFLREFADTILQYDMLTTPITTPRFHSRVLTLLSSHLSNLQLPTYDSSRTLASSHNTNPLTIPPLSPDDSPLTPNESINQLVAVTSSWIDLCSQDPLIADISRQILTLEIAYAAFCGVSFVIIPGPRLQHGSLHAEGLMYYARAIQDILSVGPYIQIHIWLQMVDNPDVVADEMGDLALAFDAHMKTWASNTAVSNAAAAFTEQTKGIFNALSKRIHRENTQLYPVADALP